MVDVPASHVGLPAKLRQSWYGKPGMQPGMHSWYGNVWYVKPNATWETWETYLVWYVNVFVQSCSIHLCKFSWHLPHGVPGKC